jgi:hypothetical protein
VAAPQSVTIAIIGGTDDDKIRLRASEMHRKVAVLRGRHEAIRF